MLANLKAILIAVAITAVIVGSSTFLVAWRYFDRAAEVSALKSQIAARDADLAIAKSAAASAKAAAAAMEQKATENQGYVDDLEKELAARPGRDACRLTGDDAERLRQIR